MSSTYYGGLEMDRSHGILMLVTVICFAVMGAGGYYLSERNSCIDRRRFIHRELYGTISRIYYYDTIYPDLPIIEMTSFAGGNKLTLSAGGPYGAALVPHATLGDTVSKKAGSDSIYIWFDRNEITAYRPVFGCDSEDIPAAK